jgi:hypothetical protein
MASVLRWSTVHLTTPSTVLGQARHRARENPRTCITSEILHADGVPMAERVVGRILADPGRGVQRLSRC